MKRQQNNPNLKKHWLTIFRRPHTAGELRDSHPSSVLDGIEGGALTNHQRMQLVSRARRRRRMLPDDRSDLISNLWRNTQFFRVWVERNRRNLR